MKYMGSKRRIAKYILPIILKNRRFDQWYIEPFVGGGNIIDKVTGKRIGADVNKYVIEALISIRDHIQELPKNNKEFTEDDYKKLRLNDEYKHKGYAGFSFSYGGKWLGGWGRDKGNKRDYIEEAYNNAKKQHENIQNVEFINVSYDQLEIPNRSIIYCDPPYENTTKYTNNFDYKKFWEWCRIKSKEGHKVFISEYNAPEDFMCIFEMELISSLTKNTGSKKGIEKLFIYKDSIEKTSNSILDIL